MKFTIRTTPINHDIPIASVKVKSVLSNDVVQLIDFSHMIENNMVSAAKQMTSTPLFSNASGDEMYSLRAKSGFGNISITNEYHYNRTTGEVTPLFYSHYLHRTYFNSDNLEKTVRRTIRSGSERSDRILSAILPASEEYLLLGDSVSVKKLTGLNPGWLKHWQYVVNYGEGKLTILSDVSEIGSTFEIRYKLIPIDISVDSFDKAPYRPELWPAIYKICRDCAGTGCDTCKGKGRIPYPDHYTVNLLSSSKEQLLVSYRSYTSVSLVEELTEYTNPADTFTQVSEEVRKDIVDDLNNTWECDPIRYRVYSLIEDPVDYRDSIRSYTYNPDTKFTFKSNTKYSTRIRLVKPYSIGYQVDWFPKVVPGKIKLHDGTSYSTGTVLDWQSISSVSEQATVVNSTTLSVSVGKVFAMYTHDFGWYGVTVIRDDNTLIEVESVDIENGLIYLSSEISRRDKLTVRYYTKVTGPDVKVVCLNPLSTHNYHNRDIRNVILLYVLGEEQSGELPIYVKILDKYLNDAIISYTYESIDEELNSQNSYIRNKYRADILEDLPQKYLGNTFKRLEPLALIYVVNPLDEDGYLLEDARIFGGGTPERHRSFYDHSYFDGEATDMDSYLVYSFPDSIYTDLVSRAKLWDPETIIAEDPDAYAQEAAQNLLREKVRKYSQIGTKQEIKIG